MGNYILKRVKVEAFKYGIDEQPDWFQIRVLNNSIYTYPEYCQIEKGSKWIRCNKGEWLVYNPEMKEIFVFDSIKFHKTYESI